MRSLILLALPLSIALVGSPQTQDGQGPQGEFKKAKPGDKKRSGPTWKDEPGFRVDCDDFATVRPPNSEIWDRVDMMGFPLSEAVDIAVAYTQDEQKWDQVRVTNATFVASPKPFYEIELLTRKTPEETEGEAAAAPSETRRWQLFVGRQKKVKRWLARERFPGSPVRGELVELPSGVMVYDIREGDGARLEQDSKVRVHYTSSTLIGLLVSDTRYNRSPENWDLSTHPVRGIAEGLVGARVGGVRKLIIPPELAYGEKGRPELGIPPNATVIFDIEILRAE